MINRSRFDSQRRQSFLIYLVVVSHSSPTGPRRTGRNISHIWSKDPPLLLCKKEPILAGMGLGHGLSIMAYAVF